MYHKTFLKEAHNTKTVKTVSESQIQKKKRKKQQYALLEQVQEETEETAIQNAKEVMEALDELAKQETLLEIQVCPKCKSPRIKRAKSTEGDMLGNMGLQQPNYECPDCGAQGHIVIKATNKPLTVREVELIREAMDEENEAAE